MNKKILTILSSVNLIAGGFTFTQGFSNNNNISKIDTSKINKLYL